jgi:hypothetical protein
MKLIGHILIEYSGTAWKVVTGT